jgi:CRISPR-associated protein Cmr4
MLYVHAISPIHTGIGQSANWIDLPVAREKHTGFPYLPGSSLKGVLRDAARPQENDDQKKAAFWRAFGPETNNASANAGELQFTDGRLLAFPVRSFYGSFAWITCRAALLRWKRDYAMVDLPNALALPQEEPKLGEARLASLDVVNKENTVYLEDLDLAALQDHGAFATLADKIARAAFEGAWQEFFKQRFVLVNDNLFAHLTQHATEVTARIKLDDESKTVADGQLWWEEAIPAESLFSCPVAVDARNTARAAAHFKLVADAAVKTLQIGGKASVGRGLIQIRPSEGIA